MAFCEIEFNRQREKTFSQKMRESDHLLEIYGKRQGQRTDLEPVPTLAQVEKGVKTRDIVADKVGMSHGTFDKARTIWDKAKDGDEQAEKLIREIDTGKKAVHTAFKEIKNAEDLQSRREELETTLWQCCHKVIRQNPGTLLPIRSACPGARSTRPS